jgi:hypothetical protein
VTCRRLQVGSGPVDDIANTLFMNMNEQVGSRLTLKAMCTVQPASDRAPFLSWMAGGQNVAGCVCQSLPLVPASTIQGGYSDERPGGALVTHAA